MSRFESIPSRAAPASLVCRALRGHAAIGLLAGALPYIISLTGTLVAIHDRWQRWEPPNIVEMTKLSPEAAQAAITTILHRPAGPRTSTLTVQLPINDLPRAVITTDQRRWHVDASGNIGARTQHGWTDFIVGLHEYLHLPATWGLILVGVLGVTLVALAVTGVLAHPRILRNAFSLRLRHEPHVAQVDWHNRMGSGPCPSSSPSP